MLRDTGYWTYFHSTGIVLVYPKVRSKFTFFYNVLCSALDCCVRSIVYTHPCILKKFRSMPNTAVSNPLKSAEKWVRFTLCKGVPVNLQYWLPNTPVLTLCGYRCGTWQVCMRNVWRDALWIIATVNGKTIAILDGCVTMIFVRILY